MEINIIQKTTKLNLIDAEIDRYLNNFKDKKVTDLLKDKKFIFHLEKRIKLTNLIK